MARPKSLSAPAFGPFMKRVEACLDRLSHDELKRRLRDHAETLSFNEREAFLELFEEEPEAPGSVAENLLEQVDELVSDLESGAYYDGWGWDSELREERPYGDESWAPTMDSLFAEAAKAFLAKNWSLAAQAYGPLLGTFELEEAFSGSAYPEQMLDTDLVEARQRYLRAVYEAAPPAERVKALVQAIADLEDRGWPEFSLQALEETTGTPLPGLDRFLPSWVEELESLTVEPSYLDRYRANALAEAVVRHGGIEGLAKLARGHGDRHPEFYDRWLAELVRADRLEEALAAASEGMERVVDGPASATLADRAASLAERMRRPDLVKRARRWAWRRSPTEERFLRLQPTTDDPTGHRLACEEIEAAGRGELELPNPLRFRLKLLADDLKTLVAETAKAQPVGWSYGWTLGSVTVPFLLVGASGAGPVPEGTMLAHLWDEVVTGTLRRERGWLGGALQPDAQSKPVEEVDLTWAPLVRAAIARTMAHPADRTKALEGARKAVEKRIEAIVSGGHRNAYARAAVLAVAVGEAMNLGGDRDEANAWLVGVRATYPRHSAFK